MRTSPLTGVTHVSQCGRFRVLEVLTAADSASDQRRVAGALHDRGLRAGDRVVLCVPGSADYVSVVLGASRSGVVPVPLDPRLTTYERDGIMRDVEPALVVDDPAIVASLLGGDPIEIGRASCRERV